MPFGSGILAVVVGIVVGGLALYLSGTFVHGKRARDLEHGVWTAVIGAIVWALLAWVPAFGSLLALIGWIIVIKWRYSSGFVRAGIHGVMAWLVALVILAVLSMLGISGLSAIGVPGV